jgi:hypothetical protein
VNEKPIIVEEINIFQAEFSETINDCQKFCYMSRAKEFQTEARDKLKILLAKAHKLKVNAIAVGHEDAANVMLSFEEMIKALMNELSMWIAFKDDDPAAAWGFLVTAQSATITAMQAHEIANNMDSYVEHLSVLEHILFPKQLFSSPGMIIREAKCSICGQEYGECDHVVGRPYMGEICSRIITQVDLEEVSFVEKPANKHARILSFTDEGGKRDFLTWRIILDTSSVSKEPDENGKTTSSFL